MASKSLFFFKDFFAKSKTVWKKKFICFLLYMFLTLLSLAVFLLFFQFSVFFQFQYNLKGYISVQWSLPLHFKKSSFCWKGELMEPLKNADHLIPRQNISKKNLTFICDVVLRSYIFDHTTLWLVVQFLAVKCQIKCPS